MIADTGSRDCASCIWSRASSSRPHGGQARHRVPVMRGRVVGIQADGALELPLRAPPIPVLRRLHVGQRGVGFGGLTVQHHGGGRAGGGLVPYVRRPPHPVVGQQAVGVGQAAVGQRVLGILDDRLLEEVHRLLQPLLGALVQVVAALQIQVVGGQVLRGPARARAPPPTRAAPGAASRSTVSATCSCKAKMSWAWPSIDSDQQ